MTIKNIQWRKVVLCVLCRQAVYHRNCPHWNSDLLCFLPPHTPVIIIIDICQRWRWQLTVHNIDDDDDNDLYLLIIGGGGGSFFLLVFTASSIRSIFWHLDENKNRNHHHHHHLLSFTAKNSFCQKFDNLFHSFIFCFLSSSVAYQIIFIWTSVVFVFYKSINQLSINSNLLTCFCCVLLIRHFNQEILNHKTTKWWWYHIYHSKTEILSKNWLHNNDNDFTATLFNLIFFGFSVCFVCFCLFLFINNENLKKNEENSS